MMLLVFFIIDFSRKTTFPGQKGQQDNTQILNILMIKPEIA